MTTTSPIFSFGTFATTPSWQPNEALRQSLVVSACLASDDRTALRSKLNELRMECAHEGWDGYGAAAVSNEAYEAAFRFISGLPNGFKMPDISADPDGCVTFEWRRSPRHTILVSVHPDYLVNYAALMGDSRHYGDEPIFDELPPRLVSLVNQLYAH